MDHKALKLTHELREKIDKIVTKRFGNVYDFEFIELPNSVIEIVVWGMVQQGYDDYNVDCIGVLHIPKNEVI